MFGEIIIIIIIVIFWGVRVWEFSLKTLFCIIIMWLFLFISNLLFLYTCIYHKCNNVREGIMVFHFVCMCGFCFFVCLFVCLFFFTTWSKHGVIKVEKNLRMVSLCFVLFLRHGWFQSLFAVFKIVTMLDLFYTNSVVNINSRIWYSSKTLIASLIFHQISVS